MTAHKSEPRPENTIWDRDLITAAKGGHINLAKEALKNGAFVDCYDKNFYTPLMLAAGNNHYEIAKLLIDSGADVTWRTPSGASPYSVAVENDAEEIAQVISDDLEIMHWYSVEPVGVPVEKDNDDDIDFLIVDSDEEEDFPIPDKSEDLPVRKMYSHSEIRTMLENWVATTWHNKNLKLMPTGTYASSEVEAAYQALVFFSKKLGVLKE